MAKQNYGINDGYRGRVGTVIGYNWRGRWCLRARPVHVSNPRTERQQAVRGGFAVLSRLASDMVVALRKGLKTCALQEGVTECNLFISLNQGALCEGGAVDFSRVAVALGPVAPVGFGTASQDDGVVRVPFERNPLHQCSSQDDEVRLFAYCPALRQGVLSGSAPRRQREVAMVLPDCWAGHEVHLYGFVQDAAGRASESAYLGCLTAGDTAPAEPESDTEQEEQPSYKAYPSGLSQSTPAVSQQGRTAPDREASD